ncbi:MAG: excinuclease ABC subunit UvrA [Burkholderiaceae bacterium]
MTTESAIRIRGARQNNLKNLSVDLPTGELIVVTGVSGSGKSSLVFDTLYAEGQRRYIETFSAYARQFLDRMDKPQVDRIEGVPPAIAIDQTNPVRTSRSTVGTMTEITDHLKLLFARVAELYCPSCQTPVQRDTLDGIVTLLAAQSEGQKLAVTFERELPEGLESQQLEDWLSAQGFTKIHAREAGLVRVIADRWVQRSEIERSRMAEAVETALRYGQGRCQVVLLDTQQVLRFSSALSCAGCGTGFREPRPALFSFNSPVGACETCRGFGRVIGIDHGLVVPDENKSLKDGAIKPWQSKSYLDCQDELLMHAKRRGVAVDIAWKDLPKEDRDWVFKGDADWRGNWKTQWYGVDRFFEYLESKAYKMHVRVLLSRYRSYTECPACHGARLRPEALYWRVAGKTVSEVMALSIDEAWDWLEGIKKTDALPEAGTKYVGSGSAGAQAAAQMVIREMAARLGFCREVGLGYLTLDRQSRTLSGGEVQRINLTTALGTSLVNTLFVLDEPSIGLHSRDLQRLIGVMHRLRDAGNSLVVVEHDPEVMRAADRIIDMGPGPGDRGGEIQFNGSFHAALGAPTLTGEYLRGERQIAPGRRSDGAPGKTSQQVIRLVNATANNLKSLTVSIPLHQLVVVTGVSGSGKSTLIQDVVYPALCKKLGKATEAPGAHEAIEGASLISDVLLVDQSPIGKTTRSNPAVYVGAFDAIRRLFSEAPVSVQRGYTAGTFSFNAGNGRCPSCAGSGFEHIEMQFLSDVYLRCPDCNGSRYRAEILDVTVMGHSIAELLELTVDEALALFQDHKEVHRRLKPLVDVGLSYLRLGQPVPTLSGGEAQRLKIAGHLADAAERGGRAQKGMLLIFDEPTTGLHFDDIAKLLRALRALIDAGHSLVVIEHNLDLISQADWLIDLGPEAGPGGGSLVAAGPIAEVMNCAESHTGQALKRVQAAQSLWQVRDAEAQTPSTRLVSDTGVTSRPSTSAATAIEIHHAREHNLKDISVKIPRNALTVISGVSGSGKSTLAFDILFAEGQRRYLESLNAYARQFVQPSARPDVDALFGIPPTVAIEQRTSRGGRKSTVGTLTEIHHFLRLLFVKLGTQFCPDCDIAIAPQSPEAIVATILKSFRGQHVGLLAPLVIQRKGIYQDLAKWAKSRGHSHLRVDGLFVPTEPFPKIDRYKEHTIELPIGDLVIGPEGEARLRELVLQTLERGQGLVTLLAPLTDAKSMQATLLSTKRACPSCSRSLPEPEPRLFSYNTRLGWCSACTGTGLFGGGLAEDETGEEDRFLQKEEKDPEEGDTEDLACPECDGARLNALARAVRIKGDGIHQVSGLALDRLPAWLQKVTQDWSDRDRSVGEGLIEEIASRVAFLRSVGLGYLSLDRSAPTLSGGEAQRIRLAAQLGSNLQGVCYILDEPSIGLHPQNNQALLGLLRRLQEKGNTLVVVEHDEDTLAIADHLIDIGPGAGRLGGEIVAQGSAQDLMNAPASVTGRYLKSPMHHPVHPRRPAAENRLEITGAALHNLQNLTVKIPLQRLTVMTGVSGSGKSSLARDILKRNMQRAVHLQRSKAGRAKTIGWEGCRQITGWESIQRVLEVDQTPIGKTPRSTPATYVGFWDDIRKLFADSEEARRRGWAANRFSFNTGQGRCESCEGQGWQTIEMNFLPDVKVVCDACAGLRFNTETRNALWRGKSISDVLQLSVSEAVEFFSAVSTIRRPLQLLDDLGLGYLTLGQPSPTLSGGESQRIKLVTELAKSKSQGQALYVLDEPTVGLHMSDVERLIAALHQLVDQGHTVVVIEHNLDVWAQADHMIDLGPEGGAHGGQLIGAGTPAEIARLKTPTGLALKQFLNRTKA